MDWFKGIAGDQTVVRLLQSEAFVQTGKSIVEYAPREEQRHR